MWYNIIIVHITIDSTVPFRYISSSELYNVFTQLRWTPFGPAGPKCAWRAGITQTLRECGCWVLVLRCDDCNIPSSMGTWDYAIYPPPRWHQYCQIVVQAAGLLFGSKLCLDTTLIKTKWRNILFPGTQMLCTLHRDWMDFILSVHCSRVCC